MDKTIHSPKYLALLKMLKEARIHQEMTMRELGEKLEITHSFVGRVEQAERRLDVYEYVQYCEALGINPDKGLAIMRDNPK